MFYRLKLLLIRALDRAVVAYVRRRPLRDVHLPTSGEFLVYFDSYRDRREICHCERMAK